MVGIAVAAISHNLGINYGAAGLGVAQLFQNQYAAALAHHKTAALGVKGDGGAGGIGGGGKGLHTGEAAHTQRADTALGPAAEHQILVAVPHAVEGVADGIGAARTGGGGAGAHALQTKADGNLTCRHIADGHGDKIGADPVKALLLALGVLFLDGRQSANAAGNDGAEPGPVGLFQINAAVLHGFPGGSHGKLGKAGHLAGLPLVNARGGVKSLDLGGQRDPGTGGVKMSDGRNAASSRLDGRPALCHRVAGGVYGAQTGDDYSAFFHKMPPHIPIPPSTHST